MTHSIANASSLLVDNRALFDNLELSHGILDLACGEGRNGLFLVSHNVPVTFADNNKAHLQSIACRLEEAGESGDRSECWAVDFETSQVAGSNPLVGKVFDAVLVFNYLHRPLFPAIIEAIRPGGLIVYETFTVDQRQFGRPRNPDFLLQHGELRKTFEGWQRIEDFEGQVSDPVRSIARLIARKPIKT